MNSTAFLLLALTLAVAMADWWAVGTGHKIAEYVAKPLTMVMLIAVALNLDVTSEPVLLAFVAALLFSLLGDVFLMLPGEQWFVFGLGAFLFGHIAYIVGLVLRGMTPGAFVVGFVVVGLAVLVIGWKILRSVRDSDTPELAVPVTAYIGVISLMVACAVGTLNPFAIVGGVLFYTSDALIAWNRFVQTYPWGRVAIMITYHLGQMGLVLSLI